MITPTMIAWTLVLFCAEFSIGYWIGYRDGKHGNIIQRRRHRQLERQLIASRLFPPPPATGTDDADKRRADD